jgi:uncharacterized protein DUF6745
MAKTVAKRAAELGADKEELVRALKTLGRLKTQVGPRKKWGTHPWQYTRPKVPLMSLRRAALFLGVDHKDAEREIRLLAPKSWTREMVLDALFDYLEKHNEWPLDKDFRRKNGLPSPGVYRQFTHWTISARDHWEREVAADKRCTPKMAIALRNVLARKEAIDRIGFQTFIKQGMATVISEHAEFGTLYELPGETPSEPMVLLKVINSTPGPDGKFEPYYLRVPPDMTEVQEAVAWTFNSNDALAGAPYAPVMET